MMKSFKDDKTVQTSDLLPAGFDSRQAMSILSDYLRNLEEAYEGLKQTYSSERRHMESDYRALLKVQDDQNQEINRLTTDLLDFTNSFEEQEGHLATATQKLLSYEKQFKKHQRELSEVSNKLTQKENDASFYRQELARSVQTNEQLTNDLDAANQKLDEHERKLAVEREASLMHEKEARRLNLLLSECQDKVLINEKKLERAVLKYSNEIKRLQDRASADAVHENNIFKKRIASITAPEMRELLAMMSRKNSDELCHHFKVIFARYIDKLNKIGLDPAAMVGKRLIAKKTIERK